MSQIFCNNVVMIMLLIPPQVLEVVFSEKSENYQSRECNNTEEDDVITATSVSSRTTVVLQTATALA